jgi:hypothetical protein
MRTRLIVLMAVLMVAAVPAAALAQTDEPATRDTVVDPDSGRDLSQLRERGLEAIERRLETIERLRQRIDDSDHLTGEHFGQLTAELARHEAGLEQLAREIEAAETGAELLAIAPKIVTEHRIYVLVVPKVAEVIGSDTGVAFAARGEEVAGVLSTWIERLADLGRDVSEAEAALGRMEANLAEGLALAGPVADEVIPLDPSDWPDPARVVLEDGRQDLEDARSEFRSARDAAKEVVAILRELIAGD